MNRSEAIDILVGVIAANSEEENEALDMAVKALQTPPISQRSMYQVGYRQGREETLKQVTGKLNNTNDSLLTTDSEVCKEQKSKLGLISRAKAIEAIEIVDWYHQNQNKDMVHGANDDEHQAWYKADDVYKTLEAIPSADRPRGEWIHTPNDRDFVWWTCSECGHKIFSETEKDRIEFHAYCGRCGADMRGDGAKSISE